MSHDTSWDVDEYKDDYESEEHWQLRRSFMVKWKDKFPEDELVCLARVFMNVEFLGCRYPKPVMTQIVHLSKDVAEEFRQKKRSKLKRTFVSASDAAQDRAKNVKRVATGVKNEQEKKYPVVRNMYGELILIEREGDNAVSNITTSCQACHIPLEATFKTIEFETECSLFVGKKLVAQKRCIVKSDSKSAAFNEGWTRLQEQCYTIVHKKISIEENATRIIPADDNKPIIEPSESFNSNIATRMMKLMGWEGGSLGAKATGISEPVLLDNEQVSRRGLGTENKALISERVNKVIHEFKASDCIDYDLIFANDFSKDQRELLHKMAQKIGLKSKSYGKNENRYLTLSTSVPPALLVKILIGRNCLTRKYELKFPSVRKE